MTYVLFFSLSVITISYCIFKYNKTILKSKKSIFVLNYMHNYACNTYFIVE